MKIKIKLKDSSNRFTSSENDSTIVHFSRTFQLTNCLKKCLISCFCSQSTCVCVCPTTVFFYLEGKNLSKLEIINCCNGFFFSFFVQLTYFVIIFFCALAICRCTEEEISLWIVEGRETVVINSLRWIKVEFVSIKK